MRKWFCDKCGKEINDCNDEILIRNYKATGSDTVSFDVCKKCAREIREEFKYIVKRTKKN